MKQIDEIGDEKNNIFKKARKLFVKG